VPKIWRHFEPDFIDMMDDGLTAAEQPQQLLRLQRSLGRRSRKY
jgi:hypothetical protein